MSVAVETSEAMSLTTGSIPRPLPPPAQLTERHFPAKLPESQTGKQG